MLQLKNPSHAYFFGFIQADGHLRRIKGNKGALTVELSSMAVGTIRRDCASLFVNLHTPEKDQFQGRA
jgi:hypothetical protein